MNHHFGWLAGWLIILGFFSGLPGLGVTPLDAHEVRPGYIEITETETDVFNIAWKQPVRDGRMQVAGLGLRPVFPENCERLSDSRMRRLPGALVEQFQLYCAGGLLGQPVAVEGLQKTITDIFVRLVTLDGHATALRLTAERPIARFSGGGAGLATYFGLGVEHLLSGLDHILFVIGLVLLVQGWRRLVFVITGFTVAHSLTLALSMLGQISFSPPVVEVVIALSILFVAIELARPAEHRSVLATRFPQAVAFIFGLLHGLGFASVLGEIGLPRDAAIWALALFNIGLEVGQLVVVGGCLLLVKWLVPSLRRQPWFRNWLTELPALGLGGLAVYWLATRSLVVFSG